MRLFKTIFLLLGEVSQAKQFRMKLYYLQRSLSSFYLVMARLDEQFFSGAVEIFFRQRCLTPRKKKLACTPIEQTEASSTPMTIVAIPSDYNRFL